MRSRNFALTILGPFLAMFVGLSVDASAADLFPDKNLEAVVRHYVFAKRDKKEPLVAADVENISTIEGNGKGIESPRGPRKMHQPRGTRSGR